MDTPPGDDRLGEAIVYVAERMAGDPGGQGAVKLNKILWWADFESFRERRRSVTGAVYQKLNEGPRSGSSAANPKETAELRRRQDGGTRPRRPEPGEGPSSPAVRLSPYSTKKTSGTWNGP